MAPRLVRGRHRKDCTEGIVYQGHELSALLEPKREGGHVMCASIPNSDKKKRAGARVESVRFAGCEQVVVLLAYAYISLVIFAPFRAGRLDDQRVRFPSSKRRRKPCPLPRCAESRTLRPATAEHVQANPYWLHSPRSGHWYVVAHREHRPPSPQRVSGHFLSPPSPY